MRPKFTKRPFYLVLLIIMALLLSACGKDNEDNQQNDAPESQKLSIQLSWFHQAQFSGFYAAVDQKYYEAENLDVTIANGGISESGYISPMEQVLSGQAQFGMASTNEIMKARANGQPFVAIASTLQRSPRGFVSLAEKNIQSPQDLVGKRVAYRPDDNSVYLAMLQIAGVSREDIIEITDASKFTLEALVNDEIDVIPIFIDNEAVALTQQGHEINIILVSDYGIETYENLIFTTEIMIQDNPDLVLRFLRATLRGYTHAVQNPDAVAALGLTYDPALDLETQKASMGRLLPLINPTGTDVGMMQAEVWENAHQVLVNQGVLAEPMDVNAAYTLQFLNQIYPS
jgi:NitT/TauT family transport system substrate-binding protein